MEDYSRRLTPEEALKIATEHPQRGKLKIFIGYAPGVGKSYTMLNEGNRRQQRGEDLVVGYVELHGRADTEKQISGLEVVPRKKIEYSGKTMDEMDTEAIIRRHPATVLVDELAHTNVPGSKYVKRYEDVDEILRAGINVITTLNVQHLESLNDVIKQITGVTVRETIPDSIVENADEVVAVDISVEALLNRLKRGDIYKRDKITDALSNFFREGNLNALREITLRQTAQEVDEELELYMKAHGIHESWQTTERIMVCVSPSPNGKRLVRRGALIARRYRCEWFVVAVENSGLFSPKWSQKDKEDLESNFALARQLGAGTVTLKGRGISEELARFAQEKNITQIVIGHSEKSPFQALFTRSTTATLLSETRNIAIHVIPIGGDTGSAPGKPGLFSSIFSPDFAVSDSWKTFAMLAVITAANLLLKKYLGYQAIGYIFLLALLILSLLVSFVHIVAFAVVSAVIWNFLFIPPVGTFSIMKTEDILMSGVYIVISIIAGYLTSKIRKDERLLAIREARTDTLYRIASVINTARDRHALIEEIEKEIGIILPGKCRVFVKDDREKFDELLRRQIAGDEKELSVALWAFEKAQPAGWSTDVLSFARSLYIPLKGPSENIGVISYQPEHDRPLSQEEMNMLLTAASQLAIYLEREIMEERAFEAQELKKSESLYRTILDSISHEMKTPVTSIMGIASALGSVRDEGKSRELVRDLSESSDRLNRIVSNLLDMSRLASGVLSIKKDWQDVSDLIKTSVQRLGDKLSKHAVKMEIDDGLPLIMADFELLEQALSNIILNAALYTPEGSAIEVSAAVHDGRMVIRVSDGGPGIKEEELPLIFNKFYRTKNAPPGGTGLGLSIAKAIIEAHDGLIEAYNKYEGGLEVRIELPIEKQPEIKELPNE